MNARLHTLPIFDIFLTIFHVKVLIYCDAAVAWGFIPIESDCLLVQKQYFLGRFELSIIFQPDLLLMFI